MKQLVLCLITSTSLLSIGFADDSRSSICRISQVSSDKTDESLVGVVSSLVRNQTMSGVVLIASGGETILKQVIQYRPASSGLRDLARLCLRDGD